MSTQSNFFFEKQKTIGARVPFLSWAMVNSLHAGKFFHDFLSSDDFFKI